MNVRKTFLVMSIEDVRNYLTHREHEELLAIMQKLKHSREKVDNRPPLKCLVVEESYHGYNALLEEIKAAGG